MIPGLQRPAGQLLSILIEGRDVDGQYAAGLYVYGMTCTAQIFPPATCKVVCNIFVRADGDGILCE